MSLLPYVPRLAFRLLHGEPGARPRSRFEALNVSVLLADISGFTVLADTLARDEGDRGAERLQEFLNQCFGPLTGLVEERGGEVLCFPGDAALAVWTGDDDDVAALATLVQRSAACGLELLARLDRFRAAPDVELRLRVAIGAGPSWAAVVGGVGNRWETVLRGHAIDQLHGALAEARPGEVLLSDGARAAAGPAVRSTRRGGFHLLVSAPASPLRQPPAARGIDAAEEALARRLVPPAILAQIDAGQRAWLAEFRTVTVAFVRLAGLSADDHTMLQRAIEVIQTVVSRFEGAVNQIVADSHDLTVVLVFGVMHHAHEDDAVRAAATCLTLRQELGALAVAAHAGLATGRVFTGARGGATRVEFAILGATVVLAARLAGIAEEVLCDRATRVACRRAVLFETLAAVALKGKATRVEVWRPFALNLDRRRSDTDIVGRHAERKTLDGLITALERQGRGGVVVLEGEAGIGKTAVVEYLLRSAQSRAVRGLVGKSDSIEQRTSYLAWRPIVASVIGPDIPHHGAAIAERLVELLGADAAPWLPLLNPVLPSPVAENARATALNAESRARTMRDLLVTLLNRAAATTPLVIVLEDAHWMDAASWQLAEEAAARVPRLLLVLSLRRHATGFSRLDRLLSRGDVITLTLGPMAPAEIRDLICRRLDVDEMPEELSRLTAQRVEGHPLFAAEMALALRDRGALVVQDGICRIAADTPSLISQPFPATVQGVVASRIDQLPPQEQLTLKVAAVFGREFDLADLAGVHPVPGGTSDLAEQVSRIADSGLLLIPPEPDRRVSFSHAIVQEVAYASLPFTQRRELHRRIAESIERAPGRSEDDGAPLLAHHWERAEVADRSMHYLEKAAGQAQLRDSSEGDAEDFLTRLISVAEASTSESGQPLVDIPMIGRISERSIKLARWERLLAQALARQGRHQLGLQHLERSLALLGQQVPRATLAVRTELVASMTMRLLRGPAPALISERSPVARAALLELARTYEKLVEFGYLNKTDLIISIVGTLRSLKAAELAGPSVELSRVYSFFANLIAMCRRQALADKYAAQGLSIAQSVGDRHALFRALTVGRLPAFVTGRWQEAATSLAEGIALAAELRIVHESLIFEYTLAHVYFNQGMLEEALARFRDVRTRAEAHGALVPQLWATVSIGEVALRQGRLNDAIAWADDTLALADSRQSIDQNSRFQAHGLLASAWLRKDGPDRALRHVPAAMTAADSGARLSYAPQSGFVGVAEVLFVLARRGGAADVEQNLKTWLRTLRLTAFSRPILDPWDLMFRGRSNFGKGYRQLATRQLRKAIRLADGMSLAYESACARAEYASLVGPRDPRSDSLRDEADVIFSRLGATWPRDPDSLPADDHP